MTNQKTAIVFGSNGLSGSALLKQLIQESTFDRIIAYSRKRLDFTHPKLENIVDSLENPAQLELPVSSDLFYCIGTTWKKAKNKDQYSRIELDMAVNIARQAWLTDVRSFIYISALGANKNSKNLYRSLKARTEVALFEVLENKLSIVRPALLLGKRKEIRILEVMAKIISRLFSFFLIGKLKKFKPIHVDDLAKAMIRISAFTQRNKLYQNADLHQISK